jgi:AcrR family transcriptional regulator
MHDMTGRKAIRSEETKRSIVEAAGELFSTKGYESVTMREIANQAGCSHTTIYIYFKDKESLLQELSIPPLKELREGMVSILEIKELVPEDKLSRISMLFIRFCLANRNTYHIFFAVKAVRVDEKEPELELNRMRNELFAFLMRGLQESLGLPGDHARLLTFSRIYFFMLQGMVGTYVNSDEPLEQLMERLNTTFSEAIDVLLYGFRYQLGEG